MERFDVQNQKEKIFVQQGYEENRIFESLVRLFIPWHEIPRETASTIQERHDFLGAKMIFC